MRKRAGFTAWAMLAGGVVMLAATGDRGLRAADAPGDASPASDQSATDAIAKLQAQNDDQNKKVIAAQWQMLDLQAALAKELTALTGAHGADVEAHTAALVEYNREIYEWAGTVAQLPGDQRNAVFDWGLSGKNLEVVAKIYGHDDDARADAVRQLAQQDASAATDAMFAALLNDKNPAIYLVAMDALFDRKPSPVLADPLMDKAFAVLNQNRQPQQTHTITVQGRTYSFADSNANFSTQYASIAADLLTQYQFPQVGEKLDAAIRSVLTTVTNTNDSRIRSVISSNFNGSAIPKLVELYKPKSVIPLCIKVLQAPTTDNLDTRQNFNGVQDQYHASSHIDAAATLLVVAGQDAASYGLVKMTNFQNGRWMIKGNAADENDMVKKVHDWLTAHGKDVGVDSVDAFVDSPVPQNAAGRNRGARAGVNPPSDMP